MVYILARITANCVVQSHLLEDWGVATMQTPSYRGGLLIVANKITKNLISMMTLGKLLIIVYYI